MPKFKIDLGQGDYLIITVENDKNYCVSRFLDDIKKQGKWFVTGKTAVQVSKIKRIEQIS